MRKLLAGALVVFGAVSGEAAPDVFWRALALVESAENDRAVGRAGEVSRYQILPRIWRQYGAGRQWAAPADARRVAGTIQEPREKAFRAKFGRDPGPCEWYILWNAPAQIGHPSRAVSERAERFSNVVATLRQGR